MKVIRPNCRAQFTAADFEFIGSVIPALKAPGDGVIGLVRDPDILDKVLDQAGLFRAILDLRGCLRVSLRFYFYVLVRHVLLKEDIRDRDVADYVAEVLAEFSLLQRMANPDPGDERRFGYMHEMIEALERMEDEDRFAMQMHIGNYALVFSGIFPGRLQRRVERRAAPGFRFYEELGAAHFRMAGNHYLARRMDMVSVLMTLGEAFHVTRLALNRLSERFVFLEADRAVQNLFRELEQPGHSGPEI